MKKITQDKLIYKHNKELRQAIISFQKIERNAKKMHKLIPENLKPELSQAFKEFEISTTNLIKCLEYELV